MTLRSCGFPSNRACGRCRDCQGDPPPGDPEPALPPPLELPPADILVRSLKSNLCPACGRGKSLDRSLCFSCYTSLPSVSRTFLYRMIGRGYEEAMLQALSELGVRKPHWPA